MGEYSKFFSNKFLGRKVRIVGRDLDEIFGSLWRNVKGLKVTLKV